MPETDVDMKPYYEASTKIGRQFWSREGFTTNAMEWLSLKWKDLHLEYHEFCGWQVSTCYHNGAWGEDGWLRGDGSLHSALLRAVEATDV